MLEQIRQLLSGADWRAFTIHFSGGRYIHVPTRQHAWVSPHGHLVIETSAHSIEVFGPEAITRVDTDPRAVHEVC